MILNVDFAPTFLDYAGVKSAKGNSGPQHHAAARGKTPQQLAQSMYYRYYDHPSEHTVQPALRRPHRPLQTDLLPRAGRMGIVRPAKDPHELNSVYDDPAYAKCR